MGAPRLFLRRVGREAKLGSRSSRVKCHGSRRGAWNLLSVLCTDGAPPVHTRPPVQDPAVSQGLAKVLSTPCLPSRKAALPV